MTRIVAGTAGGRRLRVPRSGTRPTSERVREALFSTLQVRLPAGLAGARVLDLYAGSGALGLEAASRGAAQVVLVESDRDAARICRENAGGLGLSPRVAVVAARVETYLAPGRPAGTERFDLVLADPPYALDDGDLAPVLEALVSGDWLAEGAVVVVERDRRTGGPAWPAGLAPGDRRTYGDTTLAFATVDT